MDRDTEHQLLGCLVALLILIVLVPVMAVMQGWVLTILWGWFVVPTFGLPQLSIAVAIGFSLIVSLFRGAQQSKTPDERSTEEKVGQALVLFFGPLIVLFFGWIVHLFM